MSETEFEVPAGFDPDEETPAVEDLIDPVDEPVEVPAGLSEEELRVQLHKAQKTAEFERKQRVQSERKNWIAEAKEHYPYSKPEAIDALSKREFLEKAKADDADFRERAKDLIAKAERDPEELRAEIKAQVRAEAEAAWGKPFTSGPGAPAGDQETEEALDKARRQRSLIGATKALMDGRRI